MQGRMGLVKETEGMAKGHEQTTKAGDPWEPRVEFQKSQISHKNKLMS